MRLLLGGAGGVRASEDKSFSLSVSFVRPPARNRHFCLHRSRKARGCYLLGHTLSGLLVQSSCTEDATTPQPQEDKIRLSGTLVHLSCVVLVFRLTYRRDAKRGK